MAPACPGVNGLKLRTEQREEPEINLTSLIDVVFLLLIFFMVSTTFERQAVIKVELPDAASTQQSEIDERLELIIDAEGHMYVGQNALVDSRRATLRAALIESAGDNRDQPINLRADAATPHQYVITAMDVLGEMGFVNLSIATVQIEENP